MLEPSVTDALVALVRDVSRTEIMPRFRNLAGAEIVEKSGPEDLVTIADRRAEAAIAAGLAAILPDARVIGEEACADDPALVRQIGRPGTCAIVDPIDGTANFATGLAVFGVIVAVVRDDRTLFGLLYDPVMDDWMLAHAGGGAWYCRDGTPPRRLRTRSARPIETAHVYTPLHLFAPSDRAAVAAASAGIGVARSLRCSCHEYRMLASGQVDAYLSPALKPWDHAAGALVLREAGGVVEYRGEAYVPSASEGPLAAASSPRMLETLARHFGERGYDIRATPSVA